MPISSASRACVIPRYLRQAATGCAPATSADLEGDCRLGAGASACGLVTLECIGRGGRCLGVEFVLNGLEIFLSEEIERNEASFAIPQHLDRMIAEFGGKFLPNARRNDGDGALAAALDHLKSLSKGGNCSHLSVYLIDKYRHAGSMAVTVIVSPSIAKITRHPIFMCVNVTTPSPVAMAAAAP